MCIALLKIYIVGTLFLVVGRVFQIINKGMNLKQFVESKDGALVINTSNLDVSRPLIILGEIVMIVSSIFLILNSYDVYNDVNNQITFGG